MFCKNCRNPLPSKTGSLEHCVYCGHQVSKAPIWAVCALAGAIVIITSGVLLSHFCMAKPATNVRR